MNSVTTVDLSSREFKANPYQVLARMRAETPVCRTILPNKRPAWLLTRYDDVFMVLKDDQRFVRDRRKTMTAAELAKPNRKPKMFRLLENNLLTLDAEDHARLRNLVHKAFTPRLIEQLQMRVETLANELLDTAQSRGQMDVMQDYALPIPLTIISEMLGVPPDERAAFRRMMNSFVKLGFAGNILTMAKGIPTFIGILRFLRHLVEEHRIHPQDDLITALVQAEDGGNRLSEDELINMIFLLLAAGHETTVNLIGSGTLALLENPDQMRLLGQRPELLGNAVEELVRYVSPVGSSKCYAIEDTMLHGVTIPKGDLILSLITSANRDETHFDHAEKLDITRENLKHLGFGQGIHYCVGAPLARLEGQIAISTLVRRLPTLHLATNPEDLHWRIALTTRSLEALPAAL